MRLTKKQRAAIRNLGPFIVSYSVDYADRIIGKNGARIGRVEGCLDPDIQASIIAALNVIATEPEYVAVARERLMRCAERGANHWTTDARELAYQYRKALDKARKAK